jgi:hypothetical protein
VEPVHRSRDVGRVALAGKQPAGTELPLECGDEAAEGGCGRVQGSPIAVELPVGRSSVQLLAIFQFGYGVGRAGREARSISRATAANPYSPTTRAISIVSGKENCSYALP